MGRELDNIDLSLSERREIASLLKHYLPNTEVWAYGSRVKFTATPFSDLDMVAFTSKEQSTSVARLQDAFEESSLSFRVDFFVWDEVPEQFHKNIEAERVVLQKKEDKKNLPEGWRETKLGDVIVANDDTYSQKDKWRFINYLDTGSLTENQISEIQHFVIGKDKIPSRAKRKVQPGDIVYSTVRPNQKHYGILKNPLENLLVSTGFVTIRTKKEKADTNFVYWFLVQPEIIERLQTIGEHSTSAYPSIKPSDIKGLKLNLPSLTEQRAIAHILGSLDDKIELNRQMNETLEAIALALFKSWFVDFDPVIDNALAAGNEIPEELKAKAKIRKTLANKRKPLPEKIQQLFPAEFEHTEEMGWIPKGWKSVSVKNLLDINPRIQIKRNTNAPFVDMKALPISGFSITEVSQKLYAGGAKFKNGDVLLARITPCLENGKTGVVDFLDDDQVGFGSTEFLVLRGKGVISTPFVACLSRLAKFRAHCIKSMVGSSGRQRVQNSCFSNFYLAIPNNKNLFRSFNMFVGCNFNRTTEKTLQNHTLASLRDSLLPRLLSGKILLSEERFVREDNEQ